MKKLTLWASLLALLLAAGTAAAAGLTDESLNKLLDLSGMNKQISAFPEMMAAGVDQAQAQAAAAKRTEMSADDFKALKTALSDAFQPGPILQTTGAAIKKKVSEADAQQVIAWFESDLGKKVTQAEVDTASPAARQDMIQNAQALMADKARMDFARKLDKLLHATEATLAFQEQAATAMYSAVTKQQHPDQPLDIKALQQQIHGAIEQGRPNVEMATALTFAYTYRNMDMDSLKQYRKFLERASTRRFNDAGREGMMAGMNQAVLKAADSIAALAKNKKKPG